MKFSERRQAIFFPKMFFEKINFRFNEWTNTSLKNKIKNNSFWEGSFYQSEWVEINSSWVILVFSLYAHELFCRAHLANIERFLYHYNLLF